ncbi:hypothetical protein GCM10020254_43040 [Streptomyces goshikiensis]
MIALPIVGVSAADLTLRSAELSTEQKLERVLGAADAKLTTGWVTGPLYQQPDGSDYAPVGGYENYHSSSRTEDPNVLAAALPAGARSLKDSIGHAKVHTTHGLLDTQLRELDTHSPLVKGLLTLDRGRLPEKAGEVIATQSFLTDSGYFVGSTVTPPRLDGLVQGRRRVRTARRAEAVAAHRRAREPPRTAGEDPDGRREPGASA